ncbi:MAG TPA: hypothetical protein VFV70_16110 [Hyphomonadaceae bacterium]|nr:hypothetical protein [Hyphomonadaceae bacterium]
MARSSGLVAVFTVLAVAACDSGAPKQDMSFVEGCWVTRWNSDGSVSLKMHITPAEDGRIYRGVVREFGDANDPGEDNYEFIFSHDGSWLEMDNHSPDSVRRLTSAPRPRLIAETPPPEVVAKFPDMDRMALFRFEGGDRVVVNRIGNHLGASLIHADGKAGQGFFGGQRETCE